MAIHSLNPTEISQYSQHFGGRSEVGKEVSIG
jgi:hypothetical protein